MANEEERTRNEAEKARLASEAASSIISDFAGDMDSLVSSWKGKSSFFELQKALKELETASGQKAKELKAVVASYKNFSGTGAYGRAITNIIEQATGGDRLVKSEQAEISPGHMTGMIERTRRLQDILNKPGMERVIGAERSNLGAAGVAGRAMLAGEEGNLTAYETRMREISALRVAGLITQKQHVAEVVKLNAHYATTFQKIKDISNELSVAEVSERKVNEAAKERVEAVAAAARNPLGATSLMSKGLGDIPLIGGKLRGLAEKEAKANIDITKPLSALEQGISLGLKKMGENAMVASLRFGSAGLAFMALGAMVSVVDKVRATQAKAYVSTLSGLTDKFIGSSFATAALSASQAQLTTRLLGAGSAAEKVGAMSIDAANSMGLTYKSEKDLTSAVNSMADAAISGRAIGWDYAKSLALNTVLTKSLGQANEGVTERFKRMISVSRAAGLSLDDLMSNIGDFASLSTEMGDTSAQAFYESISKMSNGLLGQFDKKFAQQSLASAGKMDMNTRAGWALASGQELGAIRGGRGGMAMAKAFDDTIQKMQSSGQISGKSGSYTDKDAFIISNVAKMMLGENVGQGLSNREDKGGKRDFTEMLDALRGKNVTPEWEKKIKDMSDPAAAGIQVMEKSVGVEEKIEGYVKRMLDILIRIGSSRLFREGGLIEDTKTVASSLWEEARRKRPANEGFRGSFLPPS